MKNFKGLLVLLFFFNGTKEAGAQNRAQAISTALPLYPPQFIDYAMQQNGIGHERNEVRKFSIDTIPYQYCQCSNEPKIVPQNRDGILRTYQAAVVASCTGLISSTTTAFKAQFASYPSRTDTGCSITNITYFWSIPVGGDIAVINGSNTSQTVSVRIKGKGPFAVRLSSTTTCSDGSSCTNFDYYPDTSRIDSSHCKCEPPLDPPIERTSVQDSSRTYKVTVNASCTGGYGFPPDLVECTTIKITYDWFISAGNNIAEIDGPADQPSVKVKSKGPGIFTLEVMGDITCSDGQTCHYHNYRDDTIPPTEEKLCLIEPTEDVEPKMNGGLRPEFNKNITIKRDEFIALGAIGRDYDKVKFSCTPSDDCEDSYSEKEVALTGRVRFEWLINAGDGNFVKLGSLPSAIKKDEGDNVIFQPPFVALPGDNENEKSITTTIQLTVIDDNPTQPIDLNIVRTITIITTRKKNRPDHYNIRIESETFTLPDPPGLDKIDGTCQATGPKWEMDNNLVKPTILLPEVADKDKMVVGQWIVLKAQDQRDNDKLKMVCQSANCTSDGFEKLYEDNVSWQWRIAGGGGRIVSGINGRFIIYEAPQQLPGNKDVINIRIRVKVKNPDNIQIADKKPAEGEIVLKVFRAGIKLQYPSLNWLPKEDNQIDLKSALVYKEDGKWKPALAHMARIHFFELLDVSREKGIALNLPHPEFANQCRDLLIKDENEHEAFNDKVTANCDKKGYFLEARTKLPVKEYTITVHSEDFGSYALLRSFANINHGENPTSKEKPVYESVPVLRQDVFHPAGRQKKTVYKDNRVNIPHDIDENKIADGGWTADGGRHITDPRDPQQDDDPTPAGDDLAGDGLSNYEEYRGFLVLQGHIRTDINAKDIFINNEDLLPLGAYELATSLNIHEIFSTHYISNFERKINFNFNPKLHPVSDDGDNKPAAVQLGLWLRAGAVVDINLLGRIFSVNDIPGPPNKVERVEVYPPVIADYCTKKKLSFTEQLNESVAHELCHAHNIYHHGEGAGVHGLRSGRFDCIMRYANVGDQLELIPFLLCTSPDGTGPNADGNGFEDADINFCRGNCKGQLRISGRRSAYPNRSIQCR